MQRLLSWLIQTSFAVALFLGVLAAGLVYMPNTPLPDRMNPTKPFDPTDELSFLTNTKLRWAERDLETCQQALRALGSQFQNLPNIRTSNQCGITDRVRLGTIAGLRVTEFETKCSMALRLGMWVYHDVKPTAAELLETELTQMSHFGSFSCRPIRSASGNTGRMSEHATANAIDVSGFKDASGAQISLLSGWDDNRHGPFLKRIGQQACRWFNATLGPNYNSLHADHFHFDQGLWRTCR